MSRNKKTNWKNREGVVYSTNDDHAYDYSGDDEQETLSPSQQKLRVQLDKKSRGGKQVTLITGFIGAEDDLKDLGKHIKSKCGVGGSAKDGEIIVQGDLRDKVVGLLVNDGYTARKL